MLLLIKLLILFLIFYSINCSENNSSVCSSETFLCPINGNCIPNDWVGDGEFDCEDGADEKYFYNNKTNIEVENTKHKIQENKTIEQTNETFIDWLAQMETELPTIFTNSEKFSQLLLKGCNFLDNKNQSVGGVWERLHVFICELLTPALIDYPKCLSSTKTCFSSSLFSNENTSIISLPCILLNYSVIHFRCIEANPPSEECSDSALEMVLTPLRQESEHWFEDLNCNNNNINIKQLNNNIKPWDVLSILSNAENICKNINLNENNLAMPIWSKLCEKSKILSENSQCLNELNNKENNKCNFQINKQLNSTCLILEAFNKNIDCSIKSLNELCPVNIQEAIIEIQEQLNDEAIVQQCFKQKEKEEEKISEEDKFILHPLNGQCNDEQEENALFCLTELSELPSRFKKLSSLENLFTNKTLLLQVCSLFDQYQKCLQKKVFPTSWNFRCALNSPMNALTRVLEPICTNNYLLTNSISCLSFNNLSSSCQHNIQMLSYLINSIIQGISNNSSIYLCKSFYLLKEIFNNCAKIEIINNNKCTINNNEILNNEFNSILEKINLIGLEEGCPKEELFNLNFNKFFKSIPSTKFNLINNNKPIAQPLPKEIDEINLEEENNNECPIEQQQKFQFCVQPLSAFQPHPLLVIKNPRQIREACLAFNNFTKCCQNLEQNNCIPLWAKGLIEMFKYACGEEGNKLFIENRQCLRHSIINNSLINDCIISFSRASPKDACNSSKYLIKCSIPLIETKCGNNAVKFIKEYVEHFAKALDNKCLLLNNNNENTKEEIAVFSSKECSSDQKHLIKQCSAPLMDLKTQLNQMFKGGLQTFLKNLNGLSTLFQKGCILSDQFRNCAESLLSNPFNCTISSCLIAAGVGICDQKDVGEAIDSNLGCVFKQVSNTEFSHCIKQHLGSLRQLNLSGLRSVLPNFVDCVQPIVIKQCGNIPLNVLRVLASNGNCPKIDKNNTELTTIITNNSQQKCTNEIRINRQNCQNNYLISKYKFKPIILLNIISFNNNNNNSELINQFCYDLDKLEECEIETNSCNFEDPSYGLTKAMKSLSSFICSSRIEYLKIYNCLLNILNSKEGKNCYYFDEEKENNEEEFCLKINKTINCISSKIFFECGNEALDFVFSATNEFIGQLIPNNSKYHLETPSVSLQTGCTEQQLVNYLECETILDKFRLRPISLISNQSQWDDFCFNALNKFKQCIKVLECKPEPATKASLTLYETVCDRPITLRDQRQFGNCLFNLTETDKGQKCLNEFKTIDLLAKDIGENVCLGINKLLQCMSEQINSKCGEEALLHVFDLNNIWANEFYKGCSLSPPEIKREEKKILPKIDFSSDQMFLNESKEEEEEENKEINRNLKEEEITTKINQEIWAEEEEEEKEGKINNNTERVVQILNNNNNIINNGKDSLLKNTNLLFLYLFLIIYLYFIN